MEKKYKHKRFGFTAEKYGLSYKISTTGQRGTEMVAPWLVEHSDDWELIEDKPYFEFITEDNELVVTPEHELNTLFLPMWEERAVTPAFMAKASNKDKWKYFYHRDNLLKYIEEHKPKSKVILKTEDGVEITDADKMVYLCTMNGDKLDVCNASNYTSYYTSVGFMYPWLPFSTVGARQKYLDSLKPKVILITQDGIDITDDRMKLFVLNSPPFSNSWNTWEASVNNMGSSDKNTPGVRIFSSEAKRDEYILESKPLLSLGEIKSAIKREIGQNASRYHRLIMRIKELAKSKL